MKPRPPFRAALAAALLLGSLAAAKAQDTIFYSTQLRPIEEASKVRDVLLKGMPGKVTYVVDEPSPFAVRMKAETQAGKRTASVVGALHGELQPHVPADLQPIDDVAAKLADRGIPAGLMDLGKLGTAQPAVRSLDAGDLRHGREQAGAAVPAGRRRRQRAHLRAVAAMGKDHRRQDRPAPARLPGRPDGPDGALLPGLLLSVLHRRRRDRRSSRPRPRRAGRP